MVAIVSLQISPSIDGRLRYGDAPEPVADVAADQDVPNDMDNPTSETFSLSVSSFFSGSDLGDGTYSFVPSIGTLAGVGLSFSGSTISGTAPTIGSVTGRARWTSSFDSNDFRDTNEFTISFAVPSFADTTAPTRVIGVTASRSGGNVTIEHLPASDPHDGVSAGSGIDKYEVLVGASVVHTEDTVAAEPSPEWLSQDIGALGAPGESSRNGAAGSARSSGFIGENSDPNKGNDKFHAFRVAPFSGNFRLSLRVSSLSSSVASAKYGLMCRFGLAPGDPFVMAQVRGSRALRLEYRPTPGVNRVTLGSGSLSANGYLILELTGNVFTMYATSSTGNDLAAIATVTLDAPQTFYLMGVLCSTSDTDLAEIEYDNFSLTAGPKIQHVFASGSAGPFLVRAVDHEDNQGATSEGAALPTNSIGKWPGTDMNFFPAIATASAGMDSNAAALDAKFNQLFTTTPVNRLSLYCPTGLFPVTSHRISWNGCYTSPSVRPANPLNYLDPGYNWSKAKAVMDTIAVNSKGAKVIYEIFDRPGRQPTWLKLAPFLGTWFSTNGPSGGSGEFTQWHRPEIVDEFLMFLSAFRDWLVANNYAQYVAHIELCEVFAGTKTLWPIGMTEENYKEGVGYRDQGAALVMKPAKLFVIRLSPGSTVSQGYLSNPILGVGSPDPDMFTAGCTPNCDPTSAQGFMQSQSNNRPIIQRTEPNGLNAGTWPAGLDQPFGYEAGGYHAPEPRHIVWYNSKNGIIRVHYLSVGWNPGTWDVTRPGVPYATLENWHAALDAAFTADPYWIYLPPGYL